MRTPKTGLACGCKRGLERDNCPACEGTGKQIDFRALRAIPLTLAAKDEPRSLTPEERALIARHYC